MPKGRILITGGCGFIGVNAAEFFISRGNPVTVLDNFSRKGTELSAGHLSSLGNVTIARGDIRSREDIDRAFKSDPPAVVIHLAAQVGVPSSLSDPADDFSINARGTLLMLEAVRRHAPEAIFLFASTNKVYGALSGIGTKAVDRRLVLESRPGGIAEDQPLDFLTPYGCSKGAADQYALDYYRCYGIKTVVFRQSCVYGPWQFGTEDQGWVAWFLIANLLGRKLTFYGSGAQTRDLLYVTDLINAYAGAVENIERVKGAAINIGGGPHFTLSLLELADMMPALTKKPAVWDKGPDRTGDQPIYVSDNSLAARLLGWAPKISPEQGIPLLLNWLGAHEKEIRELYFGEEGGS